MTQGVDTADKPETNDPGISAATAVTSGWGNAVVFRQRKKEKQLDPRGRKRNAKRSYIRAEEKQL